MLFAPVSSRSLGLSDAPNVKRRLVRDMVKDNARHVHACNGDKRQKSEDVVQKRSHFSR